MSSFNDPLQYQRFFEGNIGAIKRIAIEEHDAMASDIKTAQKSLTSGGITTKKLRELGHPFSRARWKTLDPMIKRAARKRRQGVGHVPLLPINRQTGKLQKSLQAKKIKYPDALNVNQIEFTAPHAKFILGAKGTKRMLPRGFAQAVVKIFKKRERNMKQKFRYRVVQLFGQQLGGKQ